MRLSTFALVGLVGLAGLVVLSACSSSRRPAGPPRWSPNKEEPRDENFHGGPNAILLQYDANHDGTLTKDELIAGLKADFAKADTLHKNCLNAEQADAINQQRVILDQSTATPLQDWNGDGCIDYQEFSTAAYSLFDQLDANSDGKITPQEFTPGRRPAAAPAGQRPAGQGGQGGGRRRGGGGGGPPPDGGQGQGTPPAQLF